MLPPRALQSIDGLAPADLAHVLKAARELRIASLDGSPAGAPLLGKNLALLRPNLPEADDSPLGRAADALGARVAHLDFSEPAQPPARRFRDMSQLLGRLYDAIDCRNLPPAFMRELQQHAGVPVYDGLERDDHPVRALADLLTLADHGCKAGPETPIFLLGDAGSLRYGTFASAAHLTGHEVRPLASTAGASSAPVFSVDAQDWTLRSPNGPIGEAERGVNLRFVLQAVLLGSIPRG